MPEIWIKKEGTIYYIYTGGHCVGVADDFNVVIEKIKEIEAEHEKMFAKYSLTPLPKFN